MLRGLCERHLPCIKFVMRKDCHYPSHKRSTTFAQHSQQINKLSCGMSAIIAVEISYHFDLSVLSTKDITLNRHQRRALADIRVHSAYSLCGAEQCATLSVVAYEVPRYASPVLNYVTDVRVCAMCMEIKYCLPLRLARTGMSVLLKFTS